MFDSHIVSINHSYVYQDKEHYKNEYRRYKSENDKLQENCAQLQKEFETTKVRQRICTFCVCVCDLLQCVNYQCTFITVRYIEFFVMISVLDYLYVHASHNWHVFDSYMSIDVNGEESV